MAEENKPVKQHVHNYIQLSDEQFNRLFNAAPAAPAQAQVVQAQPMDTMSQCMGAMASFVMPFMMMGMMRNFMH